MTSPHEVPIIDVAPLLKRDVAGSARAAAEIARACRDLGFFYATGHGVSAGTIAALDAASRRFFALPTAEKMEIAMARGGRAWRGFFPLGGELTSGAPDLKEGVYFGEELDARDERVAAGWPLHGANLFPAAVPELRPAVLQYIDEAAHAAHAIMEGIALSLALDRDYFAARYTARPTILFRVFHYPPAPAADAGWGVGEHTDYGLLTLLAQDAAGGLQVKTPAGWIDAPPVEGALVCNIGDMLDRLTAGAYRSTPHRVRNVSGEERLSFPFFFDPAFDAEIVPLPRRVAATDSNVNTESAPERWDGANVHAISGPYRDYLLAKIAKVFPDLAQGVSP
jgi:isopenicillin N synthase-like dioxygenase